MLIAAAQGIGETDALMQKESNALQQLDCMRAFVRSFVRVAYDVHSEGRLWLSMMHVVSKGKTKKDRCSEHQVSYDAERYTGVAKR